MMDQISERRILVVDDNPDIHDDYRKILVPEEAPTGLRDLETAIFGTTDEVDRDRYEVDSAFQGEEAVAMVKDAAIAGRPYSLAFVDMRMPPGLDGLETIERLWEIDRDLQVVICTAHSDHSHEDIVARTGRGHRLVILKKPFETVEVAQLASAMTAKWLATRQAQVKMVELEGIVDQRTAEIAETNRCLEAQLSELERTRSALERSEQRYALAAAGANDGLWDWDLKSGRVYYSERWGSILGLSGTGDSPDTWLSRVHPNDAASVRRAIDEHIAGRTSHLEFEHRLRTRDGSYLWVLCRGLAIRDAAGAAVRMAGSISDISRRKDFERELRRGAYLDKLTGLPNGTLFRECLERAISDRKGGGASTFAVLFLDFDNFKVINDSLGHLAGDELLVAISERLSGCLRLIVGPPVRYTLARLGGDEFVILLVGPEAAEGAVRVADAVQDALRDSARVQGMEVQVAASIGITVDDGAYVAPEDVLRDADTAMYSAKAAGKAGFALFDAEMRRCAIARLKIENDLRSAIQRNELAVAYQPIVDLESGRAIGVEALARWTHPDHGPVSPDRFIPIAEETGLIVPLGEHVLRRACSDLRRFHAALRSTELHVNVNLSSRQFAQPSLVSQVIELLGEYGLSAESLCLEVTETVVMESFEAAAATIRRLRDCRVRVFMDDFGTGYSSLSCLKLLPLSGLKLDRSFLAHLGDGMATHAIIHAIVTLAGHLNLDVVAEGVETADQLAGVLAHGCDYAQGYHFGRPMSADDMVEWLSKQGVTRLAA